MFDVTAPDGADFPSFLRFWTNFPEKCRLFHSPQSPAARYRTEPPGSPTRATGAEPAAASRAAGPATGSSRTEPDRRIHGGTWTEPGVPPAARDARESRARAARRGGRAVTLRSGPLRHEAPESDLVRS